MQDKTDNFINTLAQAVYDKKGSAITCLDVRGLSSLADFLLIAEGNVERHVVAIARSLIQTAKLENRKIYAVEGLKEGDWVIIDLGDISVHLFTPEVRNKYQIEQLFEEAGQMHLELELEKEPAIGIL